LENNRVLLYSVIFVLIFNIATIPSSFAQDYGEGSDYTPPILSYDRYGYIHNQDFDIIESIEMINDDTSSDVNIKELSQIEISKALEIFKQYGTVYSQD